jgi:hypothetical protein
MHSSFFIPVQCDLLSRYFEMFEGICEPEPFVRKKKCSLRKKSKFIANKLI